MNKDTLDLDLIINELGSWGKFQIMNYVIIMLPIILSAIYKVQYIFVAGDINYRCKVPECEKIPFNYKPGNWSSFALPSSVKQMRCHRLKPIGDTCTEASFSQKSVKCKSWVYETNDTVVHTYDLACDELKRTSIGSISGLGIFLGLPLTSYISDRFGRKVAFLCNASLNGIVCFIRSFSVNYAMHVAFEFLNSLLGSGVYSAGFILSLEMVHVSHRVIAGAILSCSYAVGQVNLACLAYALPYWRTLLRAAGIPGMCFILYVFIVNESVRFLIVRGKYKEAVRIVKKVAKINKVTFSSEVQDMLDKYELRMETIDKITINEEKKKETLRNMMRSKTILIRLVICAFWWITVTFVYYGLSINSVSLIGNKYVNFGLMSAVEVPGYILTVPCFNKLGRKKTLIISFSVCGLGLLFIAVIPNDHWLIVMVVVLISKLMISLAFNGIYVYTVELFPTGIRHRTLGACSMVGRVGSTMAPLTPALILIWAPLPYTVFGSCAFIAAALLLLTPETHKKKLPDTIREAEELGRHERTSLTPRLATVVPPNIVFDK